MVAEVDTYSMSAFSREEAKGPNICQICQQLVVKTAYRKGVGVKNRENLPMSQMDGPEDKSSLSRWKILNFKKIKT